MHPLYVLHQLRQHRGPRLVLDLPSLTLQRGRLYAVTGPNGAGKSTLLQLLAFLTTPSSGSLHFGGETVAAESDLGALRRRVTLLSQAPYLLRGSVAENVEYGLRVRGLAAAARQPLVRAALAEVGLGGFAERRAGDLSGGEQQRVALARALVLQPEVLLLDEPCSSLDAVSVAQIEMVLRYLPQRGTSVIFSTHDPQQCVRLGAEILQLCDGRLVSTPSVPPTLHRQEPNPWLSPLTLQEA